LVTVSIPTIIALITLKHGSVMMKMMMKIMPSRPE
jgi:hypothetical protein